MATPSLPTVTPKVESTTPEPVLGPAVETTAGETTATEPASSGTTPADTGSTVDRSSSVDGPALVTQAALNADPAITKAKQSGAGESILLAALAQVETPYQAGGDNPQSGFDDTGLVRYAHRAVGVEMPETTNQQVTMGVAIESLADALPGDLVSFGSPVDHVALYAGDQQIVHAPSPGETVRIEDIERPVADIRRVVMPDSVPPSLDEFTPGEMELIYQPLFDAAGRQWEVAPELLAAIADVESGFDPTAVSPVGAQGLMQFMPATAREMNVDPWNPASAVDGAARYLRTSLDQFTEPDLAIASYNAGRGAVSRYGGIPPFNETQNYVQKVREAWRARS